MIKAGSKASFTVTFDVGGHSAHTLDPSDLKFHPESGWTIEGEVHEDYYQWVNYFEASHPFFGELKGDYEDKIVAESEKAYNHFFSFHEPTIWDYLDI